MYYIFKYTFSHNVKMFMLCLLSKKGNSDWVDMLSGYKRLIEKNIPKDSDMKI